HRSVGRRTADARDRPRADPQSEDHPARRAVRGTFPGAPPPPQDRRVARARVIVRDLMPACRELAQAGQTIVLVEQNLAATLALAQRVYIINNGHIAHEGPAEEIRVRLEILQRYLGV